MSITQLNSFSDVQNFFDQVLTQNAELDDAKGSVHHAFWRNLSYDQFVNGSVPNVSDPNTGQPVPILVKGDSKKSNLILALLGQGIFDGSDFSQMPADGPPFFTADQVASIAAWIDKGCPQ
jgi:hypothetical protein